MKRLFILSFIIVQFYSETKSVKITKIINQLPVAINFYNNNSNWSLNLAENSISKVDIDIPDKEITNSDASNPSNYFPKADFSIFITQQQLTFDIKFFKHSIKNSIINTTNIPSTINAIKEIRYCYQFSNKNNIYNLDSKTYCINSTPKNIGLTFKPADQKTNYNINCDVEVLKWAKNN